MNWSSKYLIACLIWLSVLSSHWALAQDTAAASFPVFIRFSGKAVEESTGNVLTGIHNVRFSLYDDANASDPIWNETQSVSMDARGAYSVLLGTTLVDGIPLATFSEKGLRWVGVSIDDQPEIKRTMLVVSPYAVRAANADTLQGFRASDFVLVSDLRQMIASGPQTTTGTSDLSPTLRASIATTTADSTTATISGATTFSDSNDSQILYVSQQGTGMALKADSVGGITLFASNLGLTGTNYAILGSSSSPSGSAIRGEALSASTTGIGVWGTSLAAGGTGILGESAATTGLNYGIRAKNASNGGMAIYGQSIANNGVTFGVRAETNSPAGFAGYFDAKNGGTIMVGRSGSAVDQFRVDSAGNVNAAGNISGSSVTSAGALTAASVTTTGAITGASITVTQATFSQAIQAGDVQLGASGTATTSAGFDSHSLTHSASIYNSTSGQAEVYSFRMLASASGNNTPNPKAILKFQSAGPDQVFSDTGFAINSDGTLVFAPNQTFPNLAALQVANFTSDSLMVGTPDLTYGQGGFIRDDLDTVHSYVGQSGSSMHFRLSRDVPDPGGARHFLITPYKYGMAIEYPGLIEIWSTTLSVHHNNQLQPNVAPLPAQFWVGDENDTGGLYITSYRSGPTVNGEVDFAADNFDHTSHGSVHFFVRNPEDAFRFFQGQYGAPNLISQLAMDTQSTHFDLKNGIYFGSMQVLPTGNVRLFSNSSAPVEFNTAGKNLTLFPSGNVSIGNELDNAALSVGTTGQFSVSAAGAARLGSGSVVAAPFWITDGVTGGYSITPIPAPSGGGPHGHVMLAAENIDRSSHGSMYLTTRAPGDAVRFANGAFNSETLFGQAYLNGTQSSFDLFNSAVAGTIRTDSSTGAVQMGSRSIHRVEIITGDAGARLSVFPSGNVSVGNTLDAAPLAVGSQAAFRVTDQGGVQIGSGTEITRHVSVVSVMTFNSVSSAGCASFSVAVPNAVDGDTVALGIPSSLASQPDTTFFGYVSAPGFVTVRACVSGSGVISSMSGTVRVDLWRH